MRWLLVPNSFLRPFVVRTGLNRAAKEAFGTGALGDLGTDVAVEINDPWIAGAQRK